MILKIYQLSQSELLIQKLDPSYHLSVFLISLVISGSKNAVLMWKYQSSFIQSISINCYDIFAFVVTLSVLCQFIWTLHTSVGRKKLLDRVNQRSMATF